MLTAQSIKSLDASTELNRWAPASDVTHENNLLHNYVAEPHASNRRTYLGNPLFI